MQKRMNAATIPSKPFCWEATFEFAFRTSAAANARGGWRRRHATTLRERAAIFYAWLGAGRPRPPYRPAVVTFTRIAPRRLDEGDNLPSAFKAMRDELALRMGLANDAGADVLWHYRQATPQEARKPIGYYGVGVQIEC